MDTDSTENTTSETQTEQQQPTTELYSIREWIYDLNDNDDEPLVHAMYPSADNGKAFILCEKGKALTVLHLLHNIVEIASQVFPEEALQTYFGQDKTNPLVWNHPRATAGSTTYASKLATFATTSNPQDTPEDTSHTTQRNAKRNTVTGVLAAQRLP